MRVLFAAVAMMAGAGSAAAETVKTADYSFAYAYPAEVAAIPRLRAMLDKEAKTLRARTARNAAAARRDSVGAAYPFHRYDQDKTWKVVTRTPGFLSLSYEAYSFTGGAHGNPSTGALLWDKARGARLDPIAVFTSPAALERVVAPVYCARLKAERARRLAPYKDTGDLFSRCPPLSDLTLLLGSTNRRHIDRIGLIADPYVAGSYAEGQYEVTLPVTPAILATVKPAYRAAFAAR